MRLWSVNHVGVSNIACILSWSPQMSVTIPLLNTHIAAKVHACPMSSNNRSSHIKLVRVLK